MDYLSLKKKYERKLSLINYDIEIYRNSNNAELRNAVKTFEKEKEEIELLLKAINGQIE